MAKTSAGILRLARRLFWPLVGLSLLLTALQPLLAGSLPWRGDGSLHFYRLAELELAAAAGDWFPRWAPDLGYGYGFPLFHYTAPLGYQLLLPLRFLGVSTGTAFLIGYGAALTLGALGLAAWFLDQAETNSARALVPLVTVAYAPYLLYNIYYRGAYAEAWGLAWLSLGLWAVGRAVRRRSIRAALVLALTTAGLLLSHNVTALVGLPLLAAFGLLESLAAARASASASGAVAGARTVIGGLVLGTALAAFYWLPAFVNRDLILLERLADGANFNFRAHFLGVADLLALPPRIDPAQVNPELPLGLGWPALVAAVLAWLPIGRGLKPAASRARLWLTLAAGGLLFLTLPASEPLWANLPLLPLVQFPWRFLGPASLCLAGLAGIGLERVGRWGVPLFVLVTLSWGLPWLSPPRYPVPADPNPADLIAFEIETGFLGTTSAGDFLPATVEALPASDSLLPDYLALAPSPLVPRLGPSELPAAASIVDRVESWNESRWRLRASESVTLLFRRFSFPGWTLTVDGEPHSWTASQPEGLVQAELPAGDHDVRLAFESTPLWRAAGGLSVAAALACLGLVLWPADRSAAPGAGLPAVDGSGFGLLAIGLLLLTTKTLVLDRVAHPLRPERFTGDVVAGSLLQLDVRFGDALRLVGADIPQGALPADAALPVALYWTAGTARRELSVSLQLLDQQGRRLGQADAQHPAGYPLPRWAPGEYGVDRHALRPLPGTPPGTYDLWLQVYDPVSGQLVAQVDAAGRPVGVRFRLGSVTLARPASTPLLASLTSSALSTYVPGSGLLVHRAGALPAAVETGHSFPLLLFWQAERQPDGVATARFRLEARRGAATATAVRPVVDPAFPPTAWQAGDIWRDEVLLPVPPVDDAGTALSPGRYLLTLTLLNETAEPLGVPVALGNIDITTPNRNLTRPEMEEQLDLAFGGVAWLDGYGLDRRTLMPGEILTLTLSWKSLAVTPRSYTLFAQLLRDGRVLAQVDRLPGNGARPTTGWLPGEFVLDEVQLTVPPEAAVGPVDLIVGLYDAGTGQRLMTPAGADAVIIPAPLAITTGE